MVSIEYRRCIHTGCGRIFSSQVLSMAIEQRYKDNPKLVQKAQMYLKQQLHRQRHKQVQNGETDHKEFENIPYNQHPQLRS